MAGGAQQGGGIISGINVTPLVDITLVLLIIFIVTAKIVVTPAVPLDLPKAAKSDDVQVIFSVIIPAKGPTLVNGEAVATDQALEQAAETALDADDTLRVVISADGSVPHRQVMHTLDVLRQGGVTHVAFATVPGDPVPPSTGTE
jgi:biopolymer transport protein ExbD